MTLSITSSNIAALMFLGKIYEKKTIQNQVENRKTDCEYKISVNLKLP